MAWVTEASISRIDEQGSKTLWRKEQRPLTDDDIEREVRALLPELLQEGEVILARHIL